MLATLDTSLQVQMILRMSMTDVMLLMRLYPGFRQVDKPTLPAALWRVKHRIQVCDQRLLCAQVFLQLEWLDK